MKRLILMSAIAAVATAAQAQDNTTTAPQNTEITSKNAWLKVGINAGLPVGDASSISILTIGADIRGQFMSTRHFGLGLATGYNHYFGDDPVPDFGAIPLALMLRYYPKAQGIFVGGDIGYSFFTNVPGLTGGFTVKPQIGYHNYDWNFFAFYNHIFTASPADDVQSVGVTAAYNVRFHKKK